MLFRYGLSRSVASAIGTRFVTADGDASQNIGGEHSYHPPGSMLDDTEVWLDDTE